MTRQLSHKTYVTPVPGLAPPHDTAVSFGTQPYAYNNTYMVVANIIYTVEVVLHNTLQHHQLVSR